MLNIKKVNLKNTFITSQPYHNYKSVPGLFYLNFVFKCANFLIEDANVRNYEYLIDSSEELHKNNS